MSFDGLPFPDVGLRLKGSGSYETMAGKPAFNVDLNQWVRGTRSMGSRPSACTRASRGTRRGPRVAVLRAGARGGLLAPRVGFAWVEVDGQPTASTCWSRSTTTCSSPRVAPSRGSAGDPRARGVFQTWGRALAVDGEQLLLAAYDEGPEPPDPACSRRSCSWTPRWPAVRARRGAAAVFALVERESFLSYLAWEAVARHQDGYRASQLALIRRWRSPAGEWVASGRTPLGLPRRGGATATATRSSRSASARGGRALRFCMGSRRAGSTTPATSCCWPTWSRRWTCSGARPAVRLLTRVSSPTRGPCSTRPPWQRRGLHAQRPDEGLAALREAVRLEYPALAP